MEGSIVMEVFSWLLAHFPDLAAGLFFIMIVVWVTVKINDLSHRFTATEKLCQDIHTRELPEIRTELKEINTRLTKIELSLNTIITYLSTKSGKFNIGENK